MEHSSNTDEIVRAYLESGGTDIYCDLIVPKKIVVEFVYDSDSVMAFEHTRQLAQYHYVVAPKKHVLDINDEFYETVQTEILNAIRHVLSLIPYPEVGARVESNLSAFQNSKHLHFHVLGGESKSR